jgi:EAL domain-containing protein (putative c-di-GMP-specific phosphodiesterase class I)
MRAGAHGHTLQHVQGMLAEESGIASGRFNGMELESVFLPILSLPHKRVMGFDAHLHCTDDRGGTAAATESMFVPARDYAESSLLDLLGATIQVHNFFSGGAAPGLLFLNPGPEVLLDVESTATFFTELFQHYQVPRQRVVLDVPASLAGDEGFEQALAQYRKLGCLVSIDDVTVEDFDAARVCNSGAMMARVQRSVVGEATADENTSEMLAHFVSLLHEAGLLVLIDGVEARMEALIAIEADADFACGQYFGSVNRHPAQYIEPHASLADMWDAYRLGHTAASHNHPASRSLATGSLPHAPGTRNSQRPSSAEINVYRQARRPFITAIQHVASLLKAGHRFDAACDEFLALPGAIGCYLLDAHGQELGDGVDARRRPSPQSIDFNATMHSDETNWSRREYFRRALDEPEIVQVTRQYPSLCGYTHCVTFSIATTMPGEEALERTVVVCGDVDWSAYRRADS